MRPYLLETRGTLIALIAGTVVLFWSAISFAGTPTLGPDCGAGASIMGSDSAGKVTLGTDSSTCTLTFGVPYTNPPACTAMNETNGGVNPPRPEGAKTSATALVLGGMYPRVAGDVISYVCAEY
jgi:hypothetical protein